MRTTLVLDANHEALRRLRPWLDGSVGDVGADLVGTVELALHELAANIVDHAETSAPRLVIHLERLDEMLRIELRDTGRPVRLPAETELAPHPRVGGYGMVIIRQLASRVHYERSGSENVWSIDFDLQIGIDVETG